MWVLIYHLSIPIPTYLTLHKLLFTLSPYFNSMASKSSRIQYWYFLRLPLFLQLLSSLFLHLPSRKEPQGLSLTGVVVSMFASSGFTVH